MLKIEKALAAAAIAISVASPAAYAASPSASLAGGAGKAAALPGTLRHDVRTVYVRRAVPARRVVVRRVYVPYWAGTAPAYYYGAYPVYQTYPANVYVGTPVVTGTTVLAPAPVVTTAPVFPFSLF
ncbi:MAG: hypothetical protein ACLP1W_11480 [Rhodomicrobium sp.]